jgi:hypothetical protein
MRRRLLNSNSAQQPSLPADRAFVVQFHSDVRLEQDEFSGRIEHLVSGQAAHFQSQEELLSFIKKMLVGAANLPAGATRI